MESGAGAAGWWWWGGGGVGMGGYESDWRQEMKSRGFFSEGSSSQQQ